MVAYGENPRATVTGIRKGELTVRNEIDPLFANNRGLGTCTPQLTVGPMQKFW
ncbi:MAG: hypothetical protein ACJ780_05700 [Solirubrobacteraceae bacterium]|jgi:hypothetical protein